MNPLQLLLIVLSSVFTGYELFFAFLRWRGTISRMYSEEDKIHNGPTGKGYHLFSFLFNLAVLLASIFTTSIDSHIVLIIVFSIINLCTFVFMLEFIKDYLKFICG